ncbi:metallophosphoesterase [Tumidithrix helvetica]|uniref:metallophosphoesterase n=1 Tax=Tumidithrix helvetica TaxID=3457545 RepID=UPI003CC5D727
MSVDTPRTPGWLRLVIVSDTHNVDMPISLFPEGDLLIHAGDHTKNGLFSELTDAAVWLRSLADRFTYGVVAIAGNHDKPLDVETWLQTATLSQPGELWSNELMTTARDLFKDNGIDDRYAPMRLLQHSAEAIAGLKFFGSPYIGLTPRRQAMTQDNPLRYEGFARDPQRLMELYADIPPGLDVLITHSPPLGILDSSVQYGGVLREKPIAIGSVALRARLRGIPPSERPRLHVFGHEHDSGGVFWDEELGILFVNAAAVNGDRGIIKQGGDYVMKEGFRPWVIDIRVGS